MRLLLMICSIDSEFKFIGNQIIMFDQFSRGYSRGSTYLLIKGLT